MKKALIQIIGIVLIISCINNVLKAQSTPSTPALPAAADPWSPSELLAPSVLAGQIKTGNAPVIFNIGAVEDITTARHIGPVSDAKNLAKFNSAIAGLKKDEPVVIYCGCCALVKCPNVRPAYKALKAAGFTNIMVLNLPTNLKTNWTAMNYPLASK
jgi:hypothetical protein